MINQFLTKTSAGLYCAIGDFYIDPLRAVSTALVSHAHGDHAVATKGDVYCTAPTQSFMSHRFIKKSMDSYRIVNFNEPFYINGIKIIFYPAGHILGSAQIFLEYDSVRYLYTGDYKIQSDESCETIEFIECDHLITETTFASPEYAHPDPLPEIASLVKENLNVIIGAYALGKAQRLTQLITKNFPGTNVYIHPDLEVYHNIYEKHGFDLGAWKPFRRSEFDNETSSFYIVPPAYFRRYSFEKNVLKVFATGWKRSYYKCDRVLQVSDHPDWNGILEMIDRSKAKKVYTVHGDGNFLKDFLKDKIEVKIIS